MEKSKPFEKWEYEEVELTFGFRRVKKMPKLDEWLNADEPISDIETAAILRLQERLIEKVDSWNEDELKFFFISQLVDLVNFNDFKRYSSFSQRTVAVDKKNLKGEVIKLRGRIEFLVAVGRQKPRQPFFFLHEYKPQHHSSNDPKGQLLISMVASQQMDFNFSPLYGCYVLDKSWHFVLLDGSDYAVSAALDATKADIFQILKILKYCKKAIVAYLDVTMPLTD